MLNYDFIFLSTQKILRIYWVEAALYLWYKAILTKKFLRFKFLKQTFSELTQSGWFMKRLCWKPPFYYRLHFLGKETFISSDIRLFKAPTFVFSYYIRTIRSTSVESKKAFSVAGKFLCQIKNKVSLNSLCWRQKIFKS